MKRIISTQIRLLVGTIVMWILAAIIFQERLIIYGVEPVIRMVTYVQGAFLILTGVAYPGETIKAITGLGMAIVADVRSVSESMPRITREPLEALSEMQFLVRRVVSSNPRWKDCEKMLEEGFEVIESIMAFQGIAAEPIVSAVQEVPDVVPPPEVEERNPAIPIEVAESIKYETDPFRINGTDKIPVFVAETVSE